jgi:hypothetical protein
VGEESGEEWAKKVVKSGVKNVVKSGQKKW